MRTFHEQLKSFEHPGLSQPSFMRDFDEKDLQILRENLKEEEYLSFIQPFEYQDLNLETTVIHGDWHQSNMSFSTPPFIFDLDTLSRGTRVEEIARSVTHWNSVIPKTQLFENLVKGYEIIPQREVDLIIKLMITICYKKYTEFSLHNDNESAEDYRTLAKYLKKEFNFQ